MAMITDSSYVLHAIRLSALRTTDDSVTPRIVTLDSDFAANPYVSAMGLGDIDQWPEIKRALDSPPPEPTPLSASPESDDGLPDLTAGRARAGGAGGLRYTQTIMPKGRTGGAGMRVSGRTDSGSVRARRLASAGRSNSASTDVRPSMPSSRAPSDDLFIQSRPQTRPRQGSAASEPPSVLSPDALSPPPESVSEASVLDGADGLKPPSMMGTIGYDPDSSSMGVAVSAVPSELAMTVADSDPLDGAEAEMVDEGSDVDEDEVVDEEAAAPPPPVAPPQRRPSHIRQISGYRGGAPGGHQYRPSTIHEEERRSSTDTNEEPEILEFGRQVISPPPPPVPGTPAPVSALTAALNQHVPHLVSTGAGAPPPEGTASGSNPFTSLYTSVAAPPTLPSLKLEIFFPHSDEPSTPVIVNVRKDATVEEVTGHGLWKYVEEGRSPEIDDNDDEETSTVGWGLRIVEDDGEVDEDFPPLDRESQVSKFSYAQFGVVRATDTQKKQNAAMAPLIPRRPSRVIAVNRPPARDRRQVAAAAVVQSPEEDTPLSARGGGGGLSAGSTSVLLRVLVRASADVHFTTTISAPSDMYIADLTEVLVERKSLQQPASEWVLCLADMSLALPMDRTVASLEGMNELTLVRRQWAAEYGLRSDMRGGDPSASIFKRASEPVPLARFGPAGDFSGTYKKYTVMRKTPIGRHERQLAIDGDYIHILPSENRAFFDSMKTTSIHITLVASCKLSGRAGGFKLYVWRDGSRKRYEFEAANGKQAQEIIASIKQLMSIYQRERNTVLAPLRQSSQRGKR